MARLVSICAALLLLAGWRSSATQELSPRAYWPSPVGTRLASLAYAYTTGDNLTDPSLPVTGVNSDINTAVIAYLQSFELAGRTANFIFELPYTWGYSEGETVETQYIGREFEGIGDVAATISVNLMGAPAMSVDEFLLFRQAPQPILGASLRVVAPTGEYDSEYVINPGSNRWAAKAELGYIHPFNLRWLLELELGTWVFQDNDDFVHGPKKQDPITSLEAHLVRRFNPGLWGSLDINHYRGGRTTVDGERLDDLQRSSKFGATVAFPMDRKQVLKIAYSYGSVAGTDNDFSTLILTFARKL